jgi:hypothetical protein
VLRKPLHTSTVERSGGHAVAAADLFKIPQKVLGANGSMNGQTYTRIGHAELASPRLCVSHPCWHIQPAVLPKLVATQVPHSSAIAPFALKNVGRSRGLPMITWMKGPEERSGQAGSGVPWADKVPGQAWRADLAGPQISQWRSPLFRQTRPTPPTIHGKCEMVMGK